MTVVTFVDYTPLPRADNKPWAKARIEEGPAADGPWTQIELLDLVPLDLDPANPMVRDFTTEHAALEEGWYRITFIDQTGDEQQPTDPVHNVPSTLVPYRPLVTDVATLIMSRTKDRLGRELGTFAGDTRPTYTQAVDAINQAVRDVDMIIDTDVPAEAYDYARQAIALKAAMIIELSYFAEQINNNRSPYPQLRAEYEYLVGKDGDPGFLQKSIIREDEEQLTGETGMATRPSYSFPAADHRLDYDRPL